MYSCPGPILTGTTLLQAFNVIDPPSLKKVRKRIRKKSKHFREKVKKVICRPFGRRVHCKNTPPPCTSIGIQTSLVSLVGQLSHEGEIDMSRFGYLTNTNNNNNNQVSRTSRQYGTTDHSPRVSVGVGSSSSRAMKPSSPALKRKPMRATDVQTSGMAY